MAALPLTGITTSMVASAIGAATNDVGTLCSHPNINKWSRFKPIDFNAIALPDDVRNSNTGFQLFDEVTGFGTVKKAEYVKPKGGASSPYRLGDFRGYNHTAQPYDSYFPAISFTNAPPDANIYLGINDTKATFTIKVKLPDFPIWFLPFENANNRGIIRVTRGIYGTPSFKEIVGNLDVGSACSFTPELYAQNYANKTINLNCEQSLDLPRSGDKVTHTYYVYLNGVFVGGIAYNTKTGVMYRQFVQNFDDLNLWSSANVYLKSDTGITSDMYSYTSIERIKSPDGYPSGIKIKDFQNRANRNTIRVEYYFNGNYYQLVDFGSLLNPDSQLYSNVGAGVEIYAVYADTSTNKVDITLKINGKSGVSDVRLSLIAY